MELSLQSTRLVVVEKQEVVREERISTIVNCLVKEIIEDTEEFFEELYKKEDDEFHQHQLQAHPLTNKQNAKILCAYDKEEKDIASYKPDSTVNKDLKILDLHTKTTCDIINVVQTPPPKPTRPKSLEGRNQILRELIEHQNETSQAQYMEVINLQNEMERREHDNLKQKKQAVLKELLFVYERKTLQAEIKKQQKAMEELRQAHILANLTIYQQNITILQLRTSSTKDKRPSSLSNFLHKLFCRNKSSLKKKQQQVSQTKQHNDESFVGECFSRLFRRHL